MRYQQMITIAKLSMNVKKVIWDENKCNSKYQMITLSLVLTDLFFINFSVNTAINQWIKLNHKMFLSFTYI